MTAAVPATRLPAWRLAAGILILAAMFSVLASLAPVYVADYQLKSYFRGVAARPDTLTTPDDALRATVVKRAVELGLPLTPADIRITRQDGKVQMEMRYAVHFRIYQVDLHFHTAAGSR